MSDTEYLSGRVWDDVGSVTQIRIRNNINSKRIWSNVEYFINSDVWDRVWDRVYDRVRDRARNSVRERIVSTFSNRNNG